MLVERRGLFLCISMAIILRIRKNHKKILCNHVEITRYPYL